MLNELKTKVEEQVKLSVKANTEVRDLSASFAKESVERSNAFLNSLIEATMVTTKEMATCASPTELWDKQVELAGKVRETSESFAKTSAEAAQSFGKSVTDLTGEFVKLK